MIHYFFAGTIEEETIKGGWGYSHLVIHNEVDPEVKTRIKSV